jgi:ATP-binding cassette subfamily B protein
MEARFLPLLLLAMAMGFGLLHALVLFQKGTIALGDVIKYFSALSLLGFPTNTSIHSYSQISLGIASARRLLSIMNAENDLDKNDSGRADPLRGDVSFSDVSFSYDAHSTALQHISFKVQAGQTVAIVGQTGSGKTTLVRLINRTYDPDSGSVQIDGIDLRSWKLDALRSQISIIEQDIFLSPSPFLRILLLVNQQPAGGGRSGGKKGPGTRVHHRPAPRLRHHYRRARRDALRRAKAAHRSGARVSH